MVKLMIYLSFVGTAGEVPIAALIHPFTFDSVESCYEFAQNEDWRSTAELGYQWSHYCDVPEGML